ncbi:MAG: fatty acid desaturase [Flavobacteriales bacterium]|nr:fatty acid desaturase [Flavobacteriales bacterium]
MKDPKKTREPPLGWKAVSLRLQAPNMIDLPKITDPVYDPTRAHTAWDRFFLRFLRDPRDLPFPYLTLKVALLMLPLAVLLYMPFVRGWLWGLIAVVYFYLNNITFKGPFGLMMHCSTHRPLYRDAYGALNHIIPWFIAPFFGQSPETYRAHHVGMHHTENNLENDESSTMSYRRDSVRGFAHYYLRFLFTGIVTLAMYLFRRKRKRLFIGVVRGELLFILFCTAMSFVDLPATLVVFIIPFFIFRLVAMAGNWVQHTFVDADEPGHHFKNSITCINVPFNHRCWNDGYHISHHIDPTMHWTEHPAYFMEHIAEFAENEAVVFAGLNYMDVFVRLMGKRYDLLARHFVDIDGRYASDEAVIAFLKSRTSPIPVLVEKG